MRAEPDHWVEELAARYGRVVYAAAHRVLGNADDAEDVLQTVFLKLLDSPAPPDAVENWGAWLRVAATRRALDLLRRRIRQREEKIETVGELPSNAHGGPREQIDAARATHQLRIALASLADRDSRIFALRFFEELSYEEIAAQEATTVSLVGVSIHRSRKRLRQLL